MEVWPCQVSLSSPMLVRLHWAFPWLTTAFCIIVWLMVICMAILVAPRLRNGQAHLNTPLRRGIGMSTNSYSSSSIPFSSCRTGQSSLPSQQQEQQQLSDVPETGNMMTSMRRESQASRLGNSAGSARNQNGERGRREDRKRRMSSTQTEDGASAASIHSTRLYRVSLSPNSSNSHR